MNDATKKPADTLKLDTTTEGWAFSKGLVRKLNRLAKSDGRKGRKVATLAPSEHRELAESSVVSTIHFDTDGSVHTGWIIWLNRHLTFNGEHVWTA